MVMSISLMLSNLFSLIMPINEMTLVNELLRNETITANYKIAIMIPGQLSFVTQSIIIYYFTIHYIMYIMAFLGKMFGFYSNTSPF